MAQKVLGTSACPLCKFPNQEIRESEKNGKPYMVCDECGCQIFARQARSVKLLREMIAKAPVIQVEQPAPVKIERENKPAVPDSPQPEKPKEPTLLGKLWNAPMLSEGSAAI